jgi:aspartyl-tRNA(Asn)/glutamyl-tRNA(Gln) amidotransferase subunit C
MAVSRDDVKHVAALARIDISAERAGTLTAELNTILAHMEVLARVDTTMLEPLVGVSGESTPLRSDGGPSVKLAYPIDEFGPRVQDEFFLVPRLATHEGGEGSGG